MKQKNQIIVAVLVAAAFLARVLQVFAVIDFKTGFYKNKWSVLGLVLTALIFVLCGGAALFSRKAFEMVNSNGDNIVTTVISCMMSLALVYELFVENFATQGNAWQVIAMKALCFLTAIYFAGLGLSGILNFKIPDVIHTIPAFYMIMRIICSFINISSLSLIAENIFLLASYCCMLLFFVGYAAFYCFNENPASFNMKSVAAFSLCFVTSLSNIIANLFGGYTHIPFHSQVVLLAFTIFIGNFIYEKGLKKTS